MNATLLQLHLQRATGTRVSTQTVRNRLHHVGLYTRRTMICVSLTVDHYAACRRWTQEHLRWGELSGTTCSSRKNPALVYSLTIDGLSFGENVALLIILHENVRFGGGGVMVWAGVSINGHTDKYLYQEWSSDSSVI
ncbi:hypothetical protein AVEN_138460-1 [Araneus ventricosus]|uniref:Transposase Tc1-like domain-containing protein n=1 Tax=Araneus ventricosus TaxID=182803 RepID=A0A4Y2CEW5_ARAVE|nr:hypothetical protein AVEN_138460-1 [Araneus ventricosus]